MSDGYLWGMAIGMGCGLMIGLPFADEQRAIDAFNSNAVYQNDDGELCLRDLTQDGQPTVSCVPYANLGGPE